MFIRNGKHTRIIVPKPRLRQHFLQQSFMHFFPFTPTWFTPVYILIRNQYNPLPVHLGLACSALSLYLVASFLPCTVQDHIHTSQWILKHCCRLPVPFRTTSAIIPPACLPLPLPTPHFCLHLYPGSTSSWKSCAGVCEGASQDVRLHHYCPVAPGPLSRHHAGGPRVNRKSGAIRTPLVSVALIDLYWYWALHSGFSLYFLFYFYVCGFCGDLCCVSLL